MYMHGRVIRFNCHVQYLHKVTQIKNTDKNIAKCRHAGSGLEVQHYDIRNYLCSYMHLYMHSCTSLIAAADK